MELILTRPRALYYAEIEALMEIAFPPEERRPVETQRQKALTEADFRVYALTDGGCFVGLLTCWTLPGFVYVEHFAMLPCERGRGLGRKALQALFAAVSGPVVLEVEPPADELTSRRVDFYRRSGFVLWTDNAYLQPPYRKGDSPFPLCLMVHGALDSGRDFPRVRRLIHTRVYGQEDALVSY